MFIRQILILLIAMTVAVVVVLCYGCSDNGIGGAFYYNEKASYTTGSFIDSRDGKKYRTTKISGNKTWMAENLNFETSSGSWCYDFNSSNCNKYGRLYNWETAMTACPSGWHLSSRQEWDNLETAVGSPTGSRLKAKSGWYDDGNGSDDVEFSALPGGYTNARGYFSYAGTRGYWWTATDAITQYVSKYACYRDMIYSSGYIYDNGLVGEPVDGDKDIGLAVRCVQD